MLQKQITIAPVPGNNFGKCRKECSLTIVTRYLLKEFGKSLLSVTSVLMLIYLSARIAGVMARVAAGEMTGDVVFNLLLLTMVSTLALVVPPALFIAVLLSLGRMYSDNEITVLHACGMGYYTLYRAVLLFVLPVTLLVGSLSFYVSPWADVTGERLKIEAEQRADVSGISAGRFKESGDGNMVFYVEALDRENRHYRNVFIQNRGVERPSIVIAETGQERIDPETGERYLVLEAGRRYEGNPGDVDYTIFDFQQYAVRIDERNTQEAKTARIKGRSTWVLLNEGSNWAWAELNTRFAAPISTLLLALLALPLSHTSPRQGRYGKLFVAILVYVVYANALVMSETWLARGVIPPALGMWWVHLGPLILWLALQSRLSVGRR